MRKNKNEKGRISPTARHEYFRLFSVFQFLRYFPSFAQSEYQPHPIFATPPRRSVRLRSAFRPLKRHCRLYGLVVLPFVCCSVWHYGRNQCRPLSFVSGFYYQNSPKHSGMRRRPLPPTCLSLFLSLRQFQSVRLSFCLYVGLSVCLSVCLSLGLSIYHSLI